MALLLSYERTLLARFIEMSAEDQQRTLAEARRNFSTSGPLILAYEAALRII
jgi:hypothetical protein